MLKFQKVRVSVIIKFNKNDSLTQKANQTNMTFISLKTFLTNDILSLYYLFFPHVPI